ncbi:hypothetical protein [Leptospira kirschneri]|uniref:Uncharacterized protein n=2 Tax=Leptospira kirschneri TaxID=29507 RepID=A0A0E2AXY2_9LEPT|nr:hypothetical protein [Leptospira kirschneri]EKO59413.1 hypothetical protein LEP1GSC082_2257 [Leptospira kirschneri str. H2]EMK24300.1 hypothetical protein LEP1GSC008_0437 [Leptospira kirschneri serovar Bulgarica str. Nikolaevo]KXZ34075.1 hypothetical protein AYB34_08885 [Leptospira sp. ZV016]EKO13780.1 hypothetical protein LEP1GSC081_3061 [Leptospira kirschneri str. H1]EMK09090.1 hypothetical protein LEP1GSC166_0999 [Leptospira kirschneri]
MRVQFTQIEKNLSKKEQRKNQNLCLGIHKTETVGTTIIFLRENTFQNHKAAGTTTNHNCKNKF